MTQKGVGWTFRMAKYKAMATKAFSPPESRDRVRRVFPGGWTLISMPQPKTSPSSSSSKVAWPPPKRSRKVSRKEAAMSRNCSLKMAVISRVISPMTPASSPLACWTSSRWLVR